MCGRYKLQAATDIPARYNVAQRGIELRDNHNVKPTQMMPVITYNAQERQAQLEIMKWGMKPHWSKTLIINARVESVADSRFFKPMLRAQRCLIPVAGFYEWRDKQPVAFTFKDEELVSLAGLYTIEHTADGGEQHVYTIITTTANELVSPVHNRMPLVLARGDETMYLVEPDIAGLLPHLALPYPALDMDAHDVATL